VDAFRPLNGVAEDGLLAQRGGDLEYRGLLVRSRPDFDLNDVNLLKVGRHFRVSPGAKAVVGRNEQENHRLQILARQGDFLFEVHYGTDYAALSEAISVSPVYEDELTRLRV